MIIPKRYQRSRQIAQPKNLRIRYCGRGSIYGNPFEMGFHEYGGHSTHWFRHDVVVFHAQELDVIIANLGMTENEYFAPLFGFDFLSCWCGLDEECHVDTIIDRLVRLNSYIQLPMLEILVNS